MKGWLWLCLLCVGPLPAGSATLGEEDTIVVNAINAVDFEVVQGTNFGAAEYWCGAATYVERRTGRSERTRITVKRARGPSRSVPGRNSVIFTTDARQLPQAARQLTLTVDQVGTTLKSVQARRYCRDAFTRSTK